MRKQKKNSFCLFSLKFFFAWKMCQVFCTFFMQCLSLDFVKFCYGQNVISIQQQSEPQIFSEKDCMTLCGNNHIIYFYAIKY